MSGGSRRRIAVVALAAVVAASGLGGLYLAQDATPPRVSLSPEARSGSSLSVEVEASAPARSLAEFRATLLLGDQELGRLATLPGSAGEALAFEDQDSDGLLSAGDRFRIEPPEAGDFLLSLLFRTTRVADVSWRLVPDVTFGIAMIGSSNVTVDVAEAWPSHPLQSFGATLFVSGTSVAGLATLAVTSSGNLSFDDRDGDGRLGRGDRFEVSPMSAGTSAIVVSWEDVVVAARVWEVSPPPPPPTVIFSAPEPVSPGTWRSSVAGVSEAHPLDRFEVRVLNGTSIAIPAIGVDVVESSGASGGGLTLTYTDLGGGGVMTAADFFVLSGCASGSTYEIVLLWVSTASVVATVQIP